MTDADMWKVAHDDLYDRLTHLQAERDTLHAENAQLRKDLAVTEAAARWGEHSEDQWEAECKALRAELERVYSVVQAHENGEYMDDSDCLIRVGAVLNRRRSFS